MTPSIWLRHAGTQLKKYIGLDHEDIGFDKLYTYIEVEGKVVHRDDPEEGDLMVLRAKMPVDLKKRALVQYHPDLSKYGIVNSQYIMEPGEIPTVYLRGHDGFFEEMELPWLFRIYFIR